MINLIPLQQNVCKIQMQNMKKWFYFGLFFITLILCFLIMINKINTHKIEKNISAIKSQIAAQAKTVLEVQHLAQEIKALTEKINHVELTSQENQTLLRFLNELPQAIPDDLYLVSLNFHQHAGIIYGQAHQQKTVTHFLNGLKKHAHFQHIDLIKSDKRHENDNTPPIYFVINFYE